MHYLHDERLNDLKQSQKKCFQVRQDSRLGQIMYIDYLQDPFFDGWKYEEKHDFSCQQWLRLRAEKINWSKDHRFSHMSTNEQNHLRANIRECKRQCVVM